MLSLSTVDIISVNGSSDKHELHNTAKALVYSSQKINFNKKILFAPSDLNRETKELLDKNNIIHNRISCFGWNKYSNFIINELHKFIEADYCLIIQSDGFISNWELWNNEFLQYDYIGAPWFEHTILNSSWVTNEVKMLKKFSLVGNGGFSLRSKKLLLETASAPFIVDGPEDAYICQNYCEYFVQRGIKFAPVDIAYKFSRDEAGVNPLNSFGFHGCRHYINTIQL